MCDATNHATSLFKAQSYVNIRHVEHRRKIHRVWWDIIVRSMWHDTSDLSCPVDAAVVFCNAHDNVCRLCPWMWEFICFVWLKCLVWCILLRRTASTTYSSYLHTFCVHHARVYPKCCFMQDGRTVINIFMLLKESDSTMVIGCDIKIIWASESNVPSMLPFL